MIEEAFLPMRRLVRNGFRQVSLQQAHPLAENEIPTTAHEHMNMIRHDYVRADGNPALLTKCGKLD